MSCCEDVQGHWESRDKFGFLLRLGVLLEVEVMLLYLGGDSFGKVDSMDSVSTFLLEEEEIVKLGEMDKLGVG